MSEQWHCDRCAQTARQCTCPPDLINTPPHYTDGGIETIDYIRAKLTREEFIGLCRGNILKYVSRAGKKGSALEDYKKAEVYLGWLLKECV
jgi:hypothetical protein